MQKIKYIICYMLLFMLASCGNNGKNNDSTQIDNALSIKNAEFADITRHLLSNSEADTLIVFDETFPVGVCLFGDNVIVRTAKTDTCIIVFNKSTFDEKWITGVVGQGPHDVLSPDFFASYKHTNDSTFKMIDVSDRSEINLNIGEKELTKTRLPDYMGFSSSVNMLGEYTVGALNIAACMFYIYDNTTMQNNAIGYDIDCGDQIRNKISDKIGYILSANTFANMDKDRIVVPHYFFDLYSIYDFSGKLLRSICLSSDNFDGVKSASRILEDQSFIGYSSGLVKSDACYLVRLFHPKWGEHTSMQLIKMDWDGNPSVAYDFEEPINGQFDIDDNNDLYAIIQSDEDDNDTQNEKFYLLRWKLPSE